MIKYICKNCGVDYFRKKSVTKTSFCSYLCKNTFGHSIDTITKIKEKRALQIMKTRPINRGGYIFVKDWKHPLCGKQGYVAEHRLVMEKHIGRFLTKEEVVHHINHNTNDNRIENLQLFASHGQHTKLAHPEVRIKSSLSNKGVRRSIATEFKKKK